MRVKSLFSALVAATVAAVQLTPARATVTTSVASQTTLGTGSATQFFFGFVAVDPAYLTVIYTDPTGVQTILSQGTGPTQYQVDLNAPVQGQSWGIGGVVTYAPNGQAIPNGSSVTVARTLPLTQAISLQNQASYGQVGRSAERAVDILEMQVQQLSEQVGRNLTVNIANTAPPAMLPAATQAANEALCFDGTGLNVIACTTVPVGVISAVMQPFVSSQSLLAAGATLGLNAAGREGIGAGLQDDGGGNLRVTYGVAQDGGNTAVTPAFHLTTRIANGPLIYTLPRANTLWNGFGFYVEAVGGAATLAINANDAFEGSASGASVTLQAGTAAYITTDGASAGTWLVQIMTTPTTQTTIVGQSLKMRGTSCPTGTHVEDGSAISRSGYPKLFAYIGTSWGAGDGSTTFNLPYTGGLFDRGWFPGQGSFDVGRSFGSLQYDQLQSFTATYTTNVTTTNEGGGSGGLKSAANFQQFAAALSGARFGNETRPINIPVLSCIVTG